jgi:hypothetical protein
MRTLFGKCSLLPPYYCVLRGASTLTHTDSFKGVTNNYIIIQDDGNCGEKCGGLVVHQFPLFRCSIVKYQGNFFIPMKISEAARTLTMIGFGDRSSEPVVKESAIKNGDSSSESVEKTSTRNNTRTCTWYQFDFSVAKSLEPYGNLPYAIIGIKKGLLKFIELDATLELYVSLHFAFT